ncbi:MAG: DNA cytosine methyltransferase [Deltaproteobacteria bacterium]|nr:DNA cytosine methyltransferase [Deltaproteobacteria bacterium]
MNVSIPIIDLFAGPGGLGEGFSAYKTIKRRFPFRICLSVEKDYHAHQTLRLRSFFRKFSDGNAPREYYLFLKGQLSREKLFDLFPEEFADAAKEAWHAELGKVSRREVDARIRAALKGSKTWILIGGPPCQAYSTAGRSRMAKIWREKPEIRESDERHFLYKEYLRILAKHKPPVFVMENVRGLLSAKLSNGPIFRQIIRDLRNPTRVFRNIGSGRVNYRLYSFVSRSSDLSLFKEPTPPT